jgi:hypothetical protein
MTFCCSKFCNGYHDFPCTQRKSNLNNLSHSFITPLSFSKSYDSPFVKLNGYELDDFVSVTSLGIQNIYLCQHIQFFQLRLQWVWGGGAVSLRIRQLETLVCLHHVEAIYVNTLKMYEVCKVCKKMVLI